MNIDKTELLVGLFTHTSMYSIIHIFPDHIYFFSCFYHPDLVNLIVVRVLYFHLLRFFLFLFCCSAPLFTNSTVLHENFLFVCPSVWYFNCRGDAQNRVKRISPSASASTPSAESACFCQALRNQACMIHSVRPPRG